jgi:hypothetical protein
MSIKVPGWVPPTLGLVSRVAPRAVARLVGQRVLRPRQNAPQGWEIEPLRVGEPAARVDFGAHGFDCCIDFVHCHEIAGSVFANPG